MPGLLQHRRRGRSRRPRRDFAVAAVRGRERPCRVPVGVRRPAPAQRRDPRLPEPVHVRTRCRSSAADVALAQALADVASIAIVQDQATREAAIREGQLQHALNSRIAIEQAKGMIAERDSVDMDAAFSILRRFARNNNRGLTEVAGALVAGTLNVDTLARDRRPPSTATASKSRRDRAAYRHIAAWPAPRCIVGDRRVISSRALRNRGRRYTVSCQRNSCCQPRCSGPLVAPRLPRGSTV